MSADPESVRRCVSRALWPVPSTVVVMVLGLVLMAVARWKFYTPWAWWLGVAGLALGAAGTAVLIAGYLIVGRRERRG